MHIEAIDQRILSLARDSSFADAIVRAVERGDDYRAVLESAVVQLILREAEMSRLLIRMSQTQTPPVIVVADHATAAKLGDPASAL